MSLSGFLGEIAPTDAMESYWAHSLACAACGVELARLAPIDVSVDAALIASLLHDVGHLWLQRFEPDLVQETLRMTQSGDMAIDAAERTLFGVDHGGIGVWLVQSWGLSAGICKAVAHHHAPDTAQEEPLVAVVHMANVLSNALDLAHSPDSRVTWVSSASCATLGLTWGPETQPLFGRIEARSRHSFSLLNAPSHIAHSVRKDLA